jgi:trimethylamine:corrinoid methyltransferase-like protein
LIKTNALNLCQPFYPLRAQVDYLGCDHTRENFKTAFWRTEVLDYRPFETWSEAGG